MRCECRYTYVLTSRSELESIRTNSSGREEPGSLIDYIIASDTDVTTTGTKTAGRNDHSLVIALMTMTRGKDANLSPPRSTRPPVQNVLGLRLLEADWSGVRDATWLTDKLSP